MIIPTRLYVTSLGEASGPEETVHPDFPAGSEGQGQLCEGKEQSSDDATAGMSG